MRHFTLIRDSGLTGPLDSVVELGPGDSLGVGLAALLTGAGRYVGLDVVQHADLQLNLAVLDELLELLRRRAPIPADDEFPGVHPRLSDYSFPARHLGSLEQALRPERVKRIRAAVEACGEARAGNMIRYVCPWYEDSLAEAGTVDLVLSQVALQDIEDLDRAYAVMTKWLKPGGIMSHQIDFSFPGSGAHWNEHWGYSELFWKVVRGKRPFYFNRVPFSHYVEITQRHGHAIRRTVPVNGRRSIPRAAVNPRFRPLPETDFTTSSAYILSTKD